uniref:Alpha-mannosidase n=1 Tax=Oncorhynchus kisutch TaxID=8019 RepID=A0A8C7JUH7_ONCKI
MFHSLVLALPVLPKKLGIPPLHTFAPLTGALPCDFHMLNLRSVQHQVTRSEEVIVLVLHRRIQHCSGSHSGKILLCLGVSSLFRNLDLQLLQPVSLSLMYSSPPLANDSSISLEPMEISAFRLKLG